MIYVLTMAYTNGLANVFVYQDFKKAAADYEKYCQQAEKETVLDRIAFVKLGYFMTEYFRDMDCVPVQVCLKDSTTFYSKRFIED